MQNLLKKFINGKITLWKSYWIVGELLNGFIIILIFYIEIYVFSNKNIGNLLPLLSFDNFNFFNKLLLFIWTFFITIGIWKAAENYKGNFLWIALTLIFISYRLFSLRIIFY